MKNSKEYPTINIFTQKYLNSLNMVGYLISQLIVVLQKWNTRYCITIIIMICPYCSHPETKVTDKRDTQGVTRRRRECLKCKKRFTTYERAEMEIVVVKKDGRKVPYERNKILLGMVKALEKRPVTQEQINKSVNEIESKLRTMGKEVKTKIIGELVMLRLKKLDKIGYIRFASVYREFSDLSDFKKEIKEL